MVHKQNVAERPEPYVWIERSDRYFLTVTVGFLVLLMLKTLSVIHTPVEVLHASWTAALALPLALPPMARRLELTPFFWDATVALARRCVWNRPVPDATSVREAPHAAE